MIFKGKLFFKRSFKFPVQAASSRQYILSCLILIDPSHLGLFLPADEAGQDESEPVTLAPPVL